MVGDFQGGTISNISSSLTVRGGVTDNDDNTGGLVGWLRGSSIKNSNSSGSVSASGSADNVGGLVGQAGSGTTISNSWASGNISSTGDNNLGYGGLAGNNNGNISQSWASGNVSSNGTNSDQYGGLVGSLGGNGNISQSWASGNVSSNSVNSAYGGLVGSTNMDSNISQSWASGNVSSGRGSRDGGLVGSRFFGGNINGRNYRLDSKRGTIVNASNSIQLATTDLADLSGAAGDTATTHSDWHAGFNNNDPFTMFCNTNGDGTIDTNEQVPTNSVWVMPSAANTDFPVGMRNSDNVTTTTNAAGDDATYYQIPAIRCIANTAGITNQAEIDAMRKIEIDRQRHKFPDNR